jgi:hypothetical protein
MSIEKIERGGEYYIHHVAYSMFDESAVFDYYSWIYLSHIGFLIVGGEIWERGGGGTPFHRKMIHKL